MTTTRDSIDDIWGPRTPHRDGVWPVRVDERTVDDAERWVPSVCVLCSTGCGLDIGVADGRIVGVRGRPGDRVNHGRLGPGDFIRSVRRRRIAPGSGWRRGHRPSASAFGAVESPSRRRGFPTCGPRWLARRIRTFDLLIQSQVLYR
jgi:hypothetical protein